MKSILLLLMLAPVTALGQAAALSEFNLLHPVPKSMMRQDMETDRPDVTESPYTVDAGHFQFESDLIRYKKSGSADALHYQYVFAPFTVKAGLTRTTDLQLSIEPFRLEYHEEINNPEEHYANPGSLSLRLKHNLCGNDSGTFAFAVMPYVKLPAPSFFDHHKMEGGVIFPAQLKLSEQLDLGFQEEIDVVAEDEDYELQGLQTVALSYNIFDNLKGIAETYLVYHFGKKEMEHYLNVAIQFSLVRNLAVDGGILYGFQNDAERHFYCGLAWRL